jgi:hypothetical protein
MAVVMREGRGVTFARGHVQGLWERTVVAHSEGGGVEVDDGGATMTKSGT